MTLKNDTKPEEKPTYCFRNDMNLVKFDLSTEKFQNIIISRILTPTLKSLKNLHFNGVSLTEVYNARAKKVQWSYV